MPKRKPGAGDGDEINQRFGGRVRRFREFAGLSQTDVGTALGVSFQQIQKYENGKTSISLSRMQDLARLFRVSLVALLEDVQDAGSGRQVGFAEDGQQPFDHDEPHAPADRAPSAASGPVVTKLPATQRSALVEAFGRVGNPKTRRSIVALIETLGEPEASSEPPEQG